MDLKDQINRNKGKISLFYLLKLCLYSIPVITALYLIFLFITEKFKINTSDDKLINIILTSSIVMSSLLLSVLGVLLALYKESSGAAKDITKVFIWSLVPIITIGFTVGILSLLWLIIRFDVLYYAIVTFFCTIVLFTAFLIILIVDKLLPE